MSNINEVQVEEKPTTTKENTDVTYVNGLKDKEIDHESIDSETDDFVLKEPPNGGRAWLILFGCFCGLFCTQGYNYAFGVILNYYNQNVFENQMTQLSWIGSIWLALNNIVGPFYSWFTVKVGYKWMLITGVFLWCFGLMMASISTQIWQLYLTQGVLMGIGASFIWFPCLSAAQVHFSTRRGLAVGIAISGSGFGGLVLSNVIQAVIDKLGYQWALRILGFLSLVLLSITACVVRPLNELPRSTEIKPFNLRPFRNYQFCILFAIQFIVNFAFNVPSTFLASYANYLGLDPWVGTNMSAITSGVMIVGKISSGFFSDKLGRANMAFFCTAMTGIMNLAVWLPAVNAAGVWAFAVLYGLFSAGVLVTIPSILGQVVGMEDIEAANGLLYFAWFFGGLFGTPICAALINEESGQPQYGHAIIFGGVLMIAAGLLALLLRVLRGGWRPFIKV